MQIRVDDEAKGRERGRETGQDAGAGAVGEEAKYILSIDQEDV